MHWYNRNSNDVNTAQEEKATWKLVVLNKAFSSSTTTKKSIQTNKRSTLLAMLQTWAQPDEEGPEARWE